MEVNHGTFIAIQMRLLVSVQNQHEAEAALAGGADIIDAKDPELGPLGAVSLPVFRSIYTVAGHARPATAALGEAHDAVAIEAMARAFAGAGASMVKVGFAGVTTLESVACLLAAAISGAAAGSDGSCGVVAVAYADAYAVGAPDRDLILDAAIRCRAEGVLLDTADKRSTGLPDLVASKDLSWWAARAHQAGLLVALAGRLTLDNMALVRNAGADIAGVRGAACDGGRTGTVSAERVRTLRARCDASTGFSVRRKPDPTKDRSSARLPPSHRSGGPP